MPAGSNFKTDNLKPFIKWPGGKSSELGVIEASAPRTFDRYIDPFFGGGSVGFHIADEIKIVCNDICPELIDLYKMGQTKNNDFFKLAMSLSEIWDQTNLDTDFLTTIRGYYKSNNSISMQELQTLKNIELSSEYGNPFVNFKESFLTDLNKKIARTKKIAKFKGTDLSDQDLDSTTSMVFKSRLYTDLRTRYNFFRTNNIYSLERTLIFLFLREYAYAAMFRFNSDNEFNVPYGGISYNKKALASKIRMLNSEKVSKRLANAEFFCSDYKDFLQSVKPNRNDFVFVDPPYDSIFSDYDNVAFDKQNQIELRDYLVNLDTNIMVLIGETDFIRNLYSNSAWKIHSNEKNYMWNIKSRNDGKTNHLLITNY